MLNPLNNRIKMEDLISPAQLSRECNLSRARISQLMKTILQPAIKKIPGSKRVKLDRKAATKILQKSLDPSKKRDGSASTPYHEAKTQEIQAKVKKIRLENQIKERQLLRRSEVEQEISKIAVVFKDAMITLPPRLAAVCANKTEAQILKVINAEINDIFLDLIKQMERAI